MEIRCPGPIREYRYDNNQTNNLSYEHDASPTALKSGRHTEGTLYDEFKFEAGPGVPLGETLGLGNTSFFQTLVDRPGGDGAVYSNDSGFTYWLVAESPYGFGILATTADGQGLFRQTTKLRTTWRFRKNTSSARFRLEISRANMLGFVDPSLIAVCCNMIGRAEIQVHAHRIAEIGPGPDPEIVLDAPFFDAGGTIQLRASANTASNNDHVHTIWHKDVVMPQDITIEDDDTPLGDVDDYSIGGTVAGLEGSGLVLTNLSTNHLAVAADGTFAFERNYATGVRYEVRVASQPTGPGQFCSVSNGSGIVVDSDVTNIEVSCETLSSGDGQLDSGFGSDGRVTAGVPGGANDVALQPDGKILVVGNSTLSRYNADGDLDMGFGTGGIVTVEVYGASDRLQAVAVQTDGQIVVAGYSRDGVTSPVQEDFVLARYDASGNLDLNFGTGGIAVTDFESRGDGAYDLLIQPDGAIVATGSASIVDQFGLAGSDFAAVRYTSAGTLDAGFGLDGGVSTDVAGRTDLGNAAALQPDGKILLAGRVANSGGDDPDIGLVRYHPDGSLDTTFGNDGVLRDLTGEWDEAANVIVQPDGRVVVVGHTFSGGVFLLTIARYNSDGSADAQFGSNGRVTDAIMEVGRSIALQLDGSMIVAGRRAGNFAIARIDTEGNPDPSFGTNGVIEVDFFGGADEAKAVVIQADGKILVAGSAINGTATELELVRILP